MIHMFVSQRKHDVVVRTLQISDDTRIHGLRYLAKNERLFGKRAGDVDPGVYMQDGRRDFDYENRLARTGKGD
jgi:hypothetical protein